MAKTGLFKNIVLQETKNGVSIVESTGVNLKRRELVPLEWLFSISTTVSLRYPVSNFFVLW